MPGASTELLCERPQRCSTQRTPRLRSEGRKREAQMIEEFGSGKGPLATAAQTQLKSSQGSAPLHPPQLPGGFKLSHQSSPTCTGRAPAPRDLSASPHPPPSDPRPPPPPARRRRTTSPGVPRARPAGRTGAGRVAAAELCAGRASRRRPCGEVSDARPCSPGPGARPPSPPAGAKGPEESRRKARPARAARAARPRLCCASGAPAACRAHERGACHPGADLGSAERAAAAGGCGAGLAAREPGPGGRHAPSLRKLSPRVAGAAASRLPVGRRPPSGPPRGPAARPPGRSSRCPGTPCPPETSRDSVCGHVEPVAEVKEPCSLPMLSVDMENKENGSVGVKNSMENGRPPDPADWAVMDVVNYFRTAGFEEQASAFQEQEIDGKSLLLMTRNDVLTGLQLKLGPALKIYEYHVKPLQTKHLKNNSS
nr:sterile alpha motif domain-containing protein 13 [Nyctereutes procyonoides]